MLGLGLGLNKNFKKVKPFNMVSYNPSTWDEWVITGAGTTKGPSGIHLMDDGTVEASYLNTNLKPSTNYGCLINITAMQLTASASLYQLSSGAFTNASWGTSVLGNNKFVKTTLSSITTNRVGFRIGSGTAGDYVNFNSVRLFELPAGSQIAQDFTNLTANQLNAKYPF